jgi:hypothetical protein
VGCAGYLTYEAESVRFGMGMREVGYTVKFYANETEVEGIKQVCGVPGAFVSFEKKEYVNGSGKAVIRVDTQREFLRITNILLKRERGVEVINESTSIHKGILLYKRTDLKRTFGVHLSHWAWCMYILLLLLGVFSLVLAVLSRGFFGYGLLVILSLIALWISASSGRLHIWIAEGFSPEFFCPLCGMRDILNPNYVRLQQQYCHHCGTALQWYDIDDYKNFVLTPP